MRKKAEKELKKRYAIAEEIIKDKNKIENAADGRHELNYKFVAGIKHIGINRRGIIEKIVAERKNAKNIDGFICFWHKMLRQICFIVV